MTELNKMIGPRDQARSEGSCFNSYRQSPGFRKLQEQYPIQFREGWEFYGNCVFPDRPPTLDQRVANLKKEGYEVFVGDIAFWSTGVISLDTKVIFRKKREK